VREKAWMGKGKMNQRQEGDVIVCSNNFNVKVLSNMIVIPVKQT